MFTSLAQFYNSDLWKDFRSMVIIERTKGGVLLDEFSGEVITNAYDIVVHHIKPLTLANVNDYSISLNPDNVMIVTHKSHNNIHKRFGYIAERKVYMVWGAPCSGKTTFVNSIKGNSDLVCDMDNIWQCLTGGERYFKPNALKTNAFIIRDALYDSIQTRAGKWERAFVIIGKRDERLRDRLGAEEIHIDTDKTTCIERLNNDCNRSAEQKALWQGYIENYFETYIPPQ